MSTSSALVLVLALLVGSSVWVHRGPRRAHVVTGPLVGVALLVVGRAAGLSWTDLGLGVDQLPRGAIYGAAAVAAVGLGYAAALRVPSSHRFFRDTRYRLGRRGALHAAFVVVPLATVVPEELAFRAVLWGLLAEDHGAATATVVSSVLFGVWHVLPALQVTGTNAAIGRRRVLTVVLTVVFTTLAGLALAELRRRSGGVVAPGLLHWATNGFGVLASALVWSRSTGHGASSDSR